MDGQPVDPGECCAVGGWWWNGMQWVPARTPVQRALRRFGFRFGTMLFGCALFGLFFLFAIVIALHSR
jgi:hypothetical protein